jgi:hypothetical protein
MIAPTVYRRRPVVNVTALTLIVCGLLPGQAGSLPNVDFARGDLDGWVGDGFRLTTADLGAKSPLPAVTSSDDHNPARKGMLRYVLDVPHGAGLIRFHARPVFAPGCQDDGRLDVLLLGQGNRPVPRQVRTAKGWAPARALLPAEDARPREYAWDVSALAGQRLQIAVVDRDDRPGCHVVCSGFRVERIDEQERREFAGFMLALARDKQLPPMARYESRRFTALGNADPDFTASRLRDCERLYDSFFAHFGRKGFFLKAPPARLMVAVFDSQAGFEAYLGQKTPPNLVGMYHPQTNRLIVYDLQRNRGVAEGKQKALDFSRRIPLDIDRVQFVESVERQTRDYCRDANLATTMHEAAHQLSFNTGLLNRKGDVPLWVAEGLACYCEPAEAGVWQGVGAANPERLRVLAAQARGEARYVPLEELVGSDEWRKDAASILPAYAQSWALFRLLMEERPAALRAYLALIHPRRAPEHRLTDFRQAFGADLAPLERRLRAYLRDLVERHPVR